MTKFTRMVLWVWVIVAGILLGGAIYESLVLLPLWAGNPPTSVVEWKHGAPQGRFFAVITPVYGLCSLALLVLAFRMPQRVRKFALSAGAVGVLIVVWTFLFFIPILQQTQATGGAGLSGDEITRLTNQFVSWNYLRLILLIGSWIAGLRAFSVSGEEGKLA